MTATEPACKPEPDEKPDDIITHELSDLERLVFQVIERARAGVERADVLRWAWDLYGAEARRIAASMEESYNVEATW